MFGQSSARIRSSEFFGAILPGFYFLLQIGLIGVLLALEYDPIAEAYVFVSAPDVTWTNLATILQQVWAPLLVLLLFLCYLVGTVFRTAVASDTDSLCYELFHANESKRFGSRSTSTRHFMYVESLRGNKLAVSDALVTPPTNYDGVRERQDAPARPSDTPPSSNPTRRDTEINTWMWANATTQIPPWGLGLDDDDHAADNRGIWSTQYRSSDIVQREDRKKALPNDAAAGAWRTERLFGYWKSVLCLEAPAAFERAQFFEARTRFFTGMIWAARRSITAMLLVTVIALLHSMSEPVWPLAAAAILGLVACGLVAWVVLSFPRETATREGGSPAASASKPGPSKPTSTSPPEPTVSEAKAAADPEPTVSETKAAADPESPAWPTRARGWLAGRLAWLHKPPWYQSVMAAEVAATGALFYLTRFDVNHTLVVVTAAAISVGLFSFLGRRLRQVRNSELSVVHLAYCALELRPKSK